MKTYIRSRESQITIQQIRNAYYKDAENTLIDVEILVSGTLDFIPFTVDKYDGEAFGRELFQDLKDGVWGEVVPYQIAMKDPRSTDL